MALEVLSLSGNDFDEAVHDLARLRITVFREWPYLYDGDLEYEKRYLERFRNADRAFLAVARDGDRIVGAATAAPLAGEVEEFRAPFVDAGYDLTSIFYFAESLLLPSWRGQGVGNRFFDLREAHARSFGEYGLAAFCAVIRPPDHPERPDTYTPLDGFWRKRGYEPVRNMQTHFSWKDVGVAQETPKPMQFWMGRL
ncbi:MAG: GNAT family N-acetyltransferase [Pseudomonadota bacterium]